MKKIYEFDAIIKKVEDIDAAYIEFPYDIKAEFNKGRVKVHAHFDNIEYNGSIVNMGLPCYIIGVNKDIRKKLNKQAGDTVHVALHERD